MLPAERHLRCLSPPKRWVSSLGTPGSAAGYGEDLPSCVHFADSTDLASRFISICSTQLAILARLSIQFGGINCTHNIPQTSAQFQSHSSPDRNSAGSAATLTLLPSHRTAKLLFASMNVPVQIVHIKTNLINICPFCIWLISGLSYSDTH